MTREEAMKALEFQSPFCRVIPSESLPFRTNPDAVSTRCVVLPPFFPPLQSLARPLPQTRIWSNSLI